MKYFGTVLVAVVYCQESPISLKNLTESAGYNNSDDCDDDSYNAELAKEIGVSTMRASYVIGLTLLQIDACCIIYVIYRTFVRWRMAKRRLSMAYKLPFYMACFGNYNRINFFLINQEFDKYVFVPNRFHHLCLSKRQLGAYDYKLLIWPFGISTVLTAMSAHTFGSDQFWYIRQFSNASRKIISYLLIYIIQWVPLMVYLILDLASHEGLWIYFFTVGSISMGGILNAGRYIFNEGWYDKPNSFVDISSGEINSPKSIKSDEIMNMNRNWNCSLKIPTNSLNSEDTKTLEESQT
ncbi:8629_t:CDS:2, partial [Cetraspora pellucida]